MTDLTATYTEAPPAPMLAHGLMGNGSAPKTEGIDVSKWQGDIDYRQVEQDGVKFAAIRCTCGDYYTDNKFAQNWQGFGQTNILRTPYLVVAPAWSREYGHHPLTALDHWDRFMTAFGDRKPELPIVLDCELSRGMTPAYISDLIRDLCWMINDKYSRLPIIYTRGNWWNANTRSRSTFAMCDLWIARYNTFISHPWEDNAAYKPRDWDDWKFWQYSEEGVLPGIPDSHVDLDWFNGSLEDLLEYGEKPVTPPPPLPLEERVEVLENEVADLWAALESHNH